MVSLRAKLASVERTGVAPASLRFLCRLWGLLFLIVALQLLVWEYPLSAQPHYFSVPIIESLILVPASVHALLVFLFVLPCLALIVGRHCTLAGALVAILMSYLLLRDRFAFHHGWVLVVQLGLLLSLMSYADAHEERRSWSGVALFCCRAAIVVLYIGAGLSKFNENFLDGHVVHALVLWRAGPEGLLPTLLQENHWLLPLLGYSGAIAETLIGVCLLSRKTWWLALVLALTLHAGLAVTTDAGVLFQPMMISCLAFFFWANVERKTLCCPEASRWHVWLPKLDWLGAWQLENDTQASTPHIKGSKRHFGYALCASVPLLNPICWAFSLITVSALWAFL